MKVWPTIHTLLVQFAPRIAEAEAASSYDERIAIINGVSAHIAGKVEEHIAAMGDGWQDISSAPKDGKTIMLWSRFHDEPVTAGWSNGRWAARWDACSVIESQGDTWTDYKLADVPTHWRPLPKPPERKP